VFLLVILIMVAVKTETHIVVVIRIIMWYRSFVAYFKLYIAAQGLLYIISLHIFWNFCQIKLQNLSTEQ
jgi:hypothetical protein